MAYTILVHRNQSAEVKMSLKEKVAAASNALGNATTDQAAEILHSLINAITSNRYQISSGGILDMHGDASPIISAVIHSPTDTSAGTIPADSCAAAICIFERMTKENLRSAYGNLAKVKALAKRPATSDRSNRTIGIIWALRSDLTLNEIADEIEKLNETTSDKLWVDNIVVAGNGIYTYAARLPIQPKSGDWLPPAEGIKAVMAVYVQGMLKPLGEFTLNGMLFYIAGHLTFFGEQIPIADVGSTMDGAPKHGVARQGYQYDLACDLKLVPPELHQDKMIPTHPQVIKDQKGTILTTLRYLKWQDGGVIVSSGKIPLEGIVIFSGRQDILRNMQTARVSSLNFACIACQRV